MDKLSEHLARFTSYIFHPLFMPTNGMIVIYFIGKVPRFNPYSTDIDKSIALLTISILFIATSIIPLLITIALKKLNYISSLHMHNKEERAIPFILTFFCYFGAYYYLIYYLELNLNLLILCFIRFGIIAILFGTVITLLWKISIHMIGIGAVAGILTVLSKTNNEVLLYPLSITFFIAGLIAFSRLQLGAHNTKQIIAGFFLGFGCEMSGIFYLISH